MKTKTKTNGEPRGIRNNNPLNIRRSSAKWQGLVENPTDKEFCQFETMHYGLRAAFKLLQNYYFKHNCRTIRQIITRWAPPTDGNATEAYISQVSRVTQIKPDVQLHAMPGGETAWINMVYAMACMECGQAAIHSRLWFTDFKEAFRDAMK